MTSLTPDPDDMSQPFYGLTTPARSPLSGGNPQSVGDLAAVTTLPFPVAGTGSPVSDGGPFFESEHNRSKRENTVPPYSRVGDLAEADVMTYDAAMKAARNGRLIRRALWDTWLKRDETGEFHFQLPPKLAQELGTDYHADSTGRAARDWQVQ